MKKPHKTYLLVITLFIFLLYIGYQFSICSKVENLKQTQAELETTISRVTEFKNNYIKNPQPKTTNGPKPINYQENLLMILINTIRKYGLTLQELQPLKAQTTAGVSILPVSLSMIGQYHSLVEFLFALTEYPITIMNFRAHVEDSGALLITLQCLLFYTAFLPTKHRMHYAIHTPRNPFQLASSETLVDDNSALLQTPLRQIQLIGFASAKHQALGIIMLPNGNSYDIQIGSKLGLEHAQVIKIQDNKLVLATDSQKTTLTLKE